MGVRDVGTQEFLYYQQKDLEVVTEGRAGSSQHLMRYAPPPGDGVVLVSDASRSVYTPAGNHGAAAADRLIKQTYSVVRCRSVLAATLLTAPSSTSPYLEIVSAALLGSGT